MDNSNRISAWDKPLYPNQSPYPLYNGKGQERDKRISNPSEYQKAQFIYQNTYPKAVEETPNQLQMMPSRWEERQSEGVDKRAKETFQNSILNATSTEKQQRNKDLQKREEQFSYNTHRNKPYSQDLSKTLV